MSGKLTQDRKWIILIDDLFVALAVDVLGVDIFVVDVIVIVLIDNAFRLCRTARRCFARAYRR